MLREVCGEVFAAEQLQECFVRVGIREDGFGAMDLTVLEFNANRMSIFHTILVTDKK
jgi:hypothetical protein